MRHPIYEAMRAEAAAQLRTQNRGTTATVAKRRARANAIERGTCPPWRTNLLVPASYAGAQVVTAEAPLTRFTGGCAATWHPTDAEPTREGL